MSRFFATGDTDTESSGESSDEQQKPVVTISRRPYMFGDDSDDDEKRVVRSQKDKRFDELRDLIRSQKNSMKIRDVTKVQTVFESLQKAFSKAKTVVEKEGATPRFYIRSLVELEDFVKELWEDKEAKAKLSKINARALATLKQKIRKYNKDFESGIEAYRQNPVESDEEGEEEGEKDEDESDDDDVAAAPPVPKAAVAKHSKQDELESGESDDDSIDWGMSSSSSSESDTEVGGTGYYTVEYFLKKDKNKDKQESKRKVRPVGEAKKKIRFADEDDDDDGGKWETVPKRGSGQMTMQDVKKLLFGKTELDIDHNIIKKKRDELIAQRGKKTIDPSDNIEHFKLLIQLSKEAELGVGIEVMLNVDILASQFDYTTFASCMKDDVWDRCLEYMDHLITLLEEHPEVELYDSIKDDEENYSSPDKPYKIHGNILVFVERMDEEFTKVLQATDPHSTDFVTKLEGEARVEKVIKRVQEYLEKRQSGADSTVLCRIYIRRIEHLYYKIDRKAYGVPQSSIVESSDSPDAKEEGEGDTTTTEQPSEESASAVLSKLTKFIYNCQTSEQSSLSRIRTRAILCHIYHHALHNRWYQARDLMMMSHLQESINLADVVTQILYNRVLVQLGMCAFRHGMIKDAHDALVDIQSSGRSKELLAQGQGRHERSAEQEIIERRRQIPFHMHINLELMECVYLTSAMLLEIPYMAAAETEGRRRMISKSFHYQLKNREKQPLVGPPDSMREHVVAAAHAMLKGDWKNCRDFILSIKAWDLFLNVDQLKEMLARKIQEETLRTYIFTYGETYDTLSLVCLSEMFELPLKTVHSIVSKMIFKEEFLASLDEPTQMIVMHHAKPNKLQCQALLIADKIQVLADHNEELMKIKHAGPWNVHGHGGHMRQQQAGGGGWQGKHRRPPQGR